MTTGERLVEISTLSSATALDHFLNIESISGVGTVNVVGLYDLEYLGEENNLLEYQPESVSTIAYQNVDVIDISYLGEVNNLIEYLPIEEVQIEFICQK